MYNLRVGLANESSSYRLSDITLGSQFFAKHRWSILRCSCLPLNLSVKIDRFFPQLGMGLGGPIGGLVTDWSVVSNHPTLAQGLVFIDKSRFGWRWAFLMQLPLFALSLGLTFFNLHYVMSVSLNRICLMLSSSQCSYIQGNGRSALEILKKIDYGGSASLLVSVSPLLFKYNYQVN